ncbi:beta-lactamase/transpeptidase-like protein [Kockovaella imperatae]|uniref:Beta-lactamase/transpeptidase-like protein n=1 Tax=Kockovaella imperatae TaxID=4999 RepID=A0A1Y1UNE7_9TREE|nr:beta-lactamase/transpeptidase-like protein [Kockovaella imperatae]ORX39573.1 beta-lactamase/transpeptidase-like protein [Kockovaella imperatae]
MTHQTSRLSESSKQRLDELLQDKIHQGTLPCIFWAATNAQETIYENQAGLRIMGDETSGQVTPETTLELYSMTKFVVALAVLQLVDAGQLNLDDEDIVYRILPELGDQKVLQGYDENDDAILLPQAARITPRMLLNHTAGCTTPQRNAMLAKWYAKQGHQAPDGLSTKASVRSLIAPLLHQPGSTWMYSSGTDWLSILIHRMTGLTLEEYFRNQIFDLVPGKMPDTTFYPRPDIVERKAAIYLRLDNGDLKKYPNFSNDRPNTVETVSKEFLAGSGGLFGTTRDFLALCRAVLQCDPSNLSPPARPLISPASFKLLFAPSLTTDSAKAEAVKYYRWEGRWSPDPTVENMTHSLGLAVNLCDSDHGRRAGSGGWYGMARTHFWIDPASGLAAVCSTQVIGPEPDPWNGVFNAFERTLYSELESNGEATLE